jgi:alkylation response protein AidB-like acyl-CoA dehydrogenase
MRTDTDDSRAIARGFLRSQANTIEGGTSNIMRNILGERVLGLPKEPDASKDLPWKDVPRNG